MADVKRSGSLQIERVLRGHLELCNGSSETSKEQTLKLCCDSVWNVWEPRELDAEYFHSRPPVVLLTVEPSDYGIMTQLTTAIQKLQRDAPSSWVPERITIISSQDFNSDSFSLKLSQVLLSPKIYTHRLDFKVSTIVSLRLMHNGLIEEDALWYLQGWLSTCRWAGLIYGSSAVKDAAEDTSTFIGSECDNEIDM